MADWVAFAGITIVVSVGFVLLARASARAVTAALDARDDPDAPTPTVVDQLASGRAVARNVAASHGLVVVVLLGTAWYAAVPPSDLGLVPPTVQTVSLGVGLGVGLAVANAGGVRLAARVGLEPDERLRALLAPDTVAGWAGMLLVVLPLVAIAEELLFRGALIGGLAAGFDLTPWGLAAVSSVLFGLGHGLQGSAGIVVTAGLGAVLAGVFVLSGDLGVVVVAHYVVNAIEFALNEGPAAERWGG